MLNVLNVFKHASQQPRPGEPSVALFPAPSAEFECEEGGGVAGGMERGTVLFPFRSRCQELRQQQSFSEQKWCFPESRGQRGAACLPLLDRDAASKELDVVLSRSTLPSQRPATPPRPPCCTAQNTQSRARAQDSESCIQYGVSCACSATLKSNDAPRSSKPTPRKACCPPALPHARTSAHRAARPRGGTVYTRSVVQIYVRSGSHAEV